MVGGWLPLVLIYLLADFFLHDNCSPSVLSFLSKSFENSEMYTSFGGTVNYETR